MYIIIKIAILHSGIRPPHLCEYCIPGKYLAGIAKKEFQESPFPFRQRAYAVSRFEELIAGGVIKDIPESQLAAALPGAGAAADAADPCHQLLECEWFYDIVVSPAVQSRYPVI